MNQNESGRAQQYLRLKRFAMAAATYGLMLAFIWITVVGGFYRASPDTAMFLTLLVLASQLLFLLMFLSGLNLRFREPSLTLAQVLVAIGLLTLFLGYLDEARGTLLVMYVVVLLFGISQLTPRIFAICCAVAFCGFGAVLILKHYAKPIPPDVQGHLLLQVAVLALVLIWLSLFAGYVQAMRRRMQQRSVALQAHQDTLRGMMRQLEDLVATDELTGLFNRRHFLRLATRELGSLRPGREHGLALIDLDYFKRINDRFGHATGDRVLQLFAKVAKTCLRDGDILARYGGEEFVLLLPNTDTQQFSACCERLREAYAATRIEGLETERVTLSIGMTMLQMQDGLDEALHRADEALYRAKHLGRDRCEASWAASDA